MEDGKNWERRGKERTRREEKQVARRRQEGLEEKEMEGGKGTKWREEERRKGSRKRKREMKVLQEHRLEPESPLAPVSGGPCSADETFSIRLLSPRTLLPSAIHAI